MFINFNQTLTKLLSTSQLCDNGYEVKFELICLFKEASTWNILFLGMREGTSIGFV